MTAYLREHPPIRSQYRSPRRAPLRGVILLHTSESVMDSVGPDTGAENVARFIRDRDTPGSYHDLGDSDSSINLVDYDDEAYHDATGLNPSTTSVSFACRTTDWARMSPERRHRFLDQGARRAAVQARHQHKRTGKVVRPVRLTKARVLAGERGFLYHGDSDPGRRSDPGTTSAAPFPWTEFVELYRHHAADLLGGAPSKPTPPPAPKDSLMALTDTQATKLASDAQHAAMQATAAAEQARRAVEILEGKFESREKPTGKAHGTLLARIRDTVAAIDARTKG